MKSNKLIIAGLFALSLAALSAQAVVLPGSDIGGIANVGGASPGDLILGFRNAAQPDVVVDIGQFSAYDTVARDGTTYQVGGFNPSELTSVISNAFTTSGTFWTVVGSSGAGNTIVVNGVPQVDNAIWATSNGTLLRQQSGIQSGLSTQIDGVLNSGLTTSTFGGASDANVLTSPKLFTGLSSSNAYSGFFTSQVESTTVGSTSLKLWEVQPGSGNALQLGTFNLDSSGLTFTVSAIPEPSTYAAILGLATLGFVAIRRRNLVAAQV